MTESAKRDFITQMITLAEEEAGNLTAKGFDPASKLDVLKQKNTDSDQAEIAQQKAMASARDATALSKTKLDEAYKEASNLADLISGLYGKDSELVRRIRKFRK